MSTLKYTACRTQTNKADMTEANNSMLTWRLENESYRRNSRPVGNPDETLETSACYQTDHEITRNKKRKSPKCILHEGFRLLGETP